MHRFYLNSNLQPHSKIQIKDEKHHYISRVLRCRVDDLIILFNGDGQDYLARITDVSKKNLSCEIESCQQNNTKSPLKITLIQGLSKGEKMDFVMQKATELGVNDIHPTITEYSTVKLDNTRMIKKQQHWQTIIQSAAEQCGRAELPTLHPVTSLSTLLAEINQQKSDLNILFSPNAPTSLKTLSQPNSVCFLIGPEGGLSENDTTMAEQYQFISATLGNRILRTETAALSAISSAQLLWGDA